MYMFSTQVKMPLLRDNGTLKTDNGKLQHDNSFFQIFNNSFHQPFHAQNAPENTSSVRADTSLKSNRTAAQNNTEAKPEVNTGTAYQSNETTSVVPGASGLNAQTAQEGQAKMDKADYKEADLELEKKKEQEVASTPGQVNVNLISPTVEALPSHTDLAEESEKVQLLMDEIAAILNDMMVTVDAVQKIDIEGESIQAVTSKLDTLQQELAKSLTALTTSTSNLNGTQTGQHAMTFANKLQQLLGDDLIEQFITDELEITTDKVDGIQNLIQKMLRETENAKMHIFQELITEITIPAMNHTTNIVVSGQRLNEENGIVPEKPSENKGLQHSEERRVALPGKMEIETDIGLMTDSTRKTAILSANEEQKSTDLSQQPVMHPVPMASSEQTPGNQPIFTGFVKASSIQDTEVVEQVMEKAATLFHEDKSEMVMQLKPESLGKLSLRIVHERGEIAARFVAETEQVKAILESNLQLLRDSLQNSGVTVQSLSVSVGQQGQREETNSNSRQHQRLPGQIPVIAESSEMEAAHSLYWYRSISSGLYEAAKPEINLTA